MFINIEGIDGSGKTTMAAAMADEIQRNGRECLHTREPGGGKTLSKKIRETLLHSDYSFTHDEQVILMFADRIEHLTTTIEPALKAGVVVVNERFTPSTIAYQVDNGRASPMLAGMLHKAIVRPESGRDPDLTVFLDVDPETAQTRLHQNGKLDNMEREHLKKIWGLQASYRRQFQSMENAITVDANKSALEVEQEVRGLAAQLFQTHPHQMYRAGLMKRVRDHLKYGLDMCLPRRG